MTPKKQSSNSKSNTCDFIKGNICFYSLKSCLLWNWQWNSNAIATDAVAVMHTGYWQGKSSTTSLTMFLGKNFCNHIEISQTKSSFVSSVQKSPSNLQLSVGQCSEHEQKHFSPSHENLNPTFSYVNKCTFAMTYRNSKGSFALTVWEFSRAKCSHLNN